MALAPTSLSLAVQGIADVLDAHFNGDVQISIDTPLRAQENAKGGDRPYLNLFIYRMAPSGFHSDLGPEEPAFIRLYGLLTPCMTNQNGETGDEELRILGHALRVLHSEPILPLAALPPAHGGGNPDFRTELGEPRLTRYRLQSLMQAPSMEELNHIWTTQGGDLCYRLSAAYEFALVPIEPLTLREPAGPVRSGVIDLTPSVALDRDPMEPGESLLGFALAGEDRDTPPPEVWQPILLFAEKDTFTTTRAQAANSATTPIALVGAPGAALALDMVWSQNGVAQAPSPTQKIVLATHSLSDPAARLNLALPNPWPGDQVVIRVRLADGAGIPVPHAPFANTITLSAEAP